jgi:Mg2+-importing ATPase
VSAFLTALKRVSSGNLGHASAPADTKGQICPGLRHAAHIEPDEVLEELGTTAGGLTDQEAARRFDILGPNVITGGARQGVFRQLSARFWTPLNIMLLGLAAASLALGDPRAALVITAMVALSVGLSFVQEYRSNNAARKLQALVSTTATVIRRPAESPSGPSDTGRRAAPQTLDIPVVRLVPGDIVTLSAGDMIPADLRLLSAKDLFLNEAALTGEALPAEKSAHARGQDVQDLLDLPNTCFMGTSVVSGTATGVVILTGRNTYFGQIADTIVGRRPPTNFEKGVNRFVWLMVRFMVVMAPTVFVINGLTKGDWFEALLFAVAIAVGLTPEMLPMIVTVNLAKGALAMSRKRTIVKRLNSIQNFGAMDVLCTDKTGTLTQDRIILKWHLDLQGEESDEVLEFAYLNSFFQSGLRNLLDVAVLKHAELHQELCVESAFKKIDEIPFDFDRRRMSVVLEKSDGTHLLICKGAIEEIFAVCSSYEMGGEIGNLDSTHFLAAEKETTRLNADGFRVIAVAYKEIHAPPRAYAPVDENELTLLGYIAFLDPPKSSAASAITMLREHGVRVKILTGDNDVITRKICSEVGLPAQRIMLGSEMETMSDEALAGTVESVDIYAKLSPTQKARVVDALHRRGHVVGFLGDGINDGPALKAADVGISVDTAVDIAKDTADIILLEKNLVVLDAGVIEGRKVFGNITKYIKMGASSNFGNMFSVIGASIFLPFLPMAPIQVLANNLLYDVSQTAIPSDNVDDDYLATPRRWEIGNILKFMILIGPISSVFDYATYFAMLYVFDAWHNPALFQTGWFVESLLTQTLVIHVIRTSKLPFIESRASTELIATSLAIAAVGVIIPFTRLGGILGFEPLPNTYWPILVMVLACYVTLTQLAKAWFVRRFGMG